MRGRQGDVRHHQARVGQVTGVVVPALATQQLKLWFIAILVTSLWGCASPLNQPPTQGMIRRSYKEVALKVHDHYLNGEHFSGSSVTFQSPTSVHAFSNLRRIDFVLSEGMRKTWTHDTLISLIRDRERNDSVRVEVRSIRNDFGLFRASRNRVAETEQKRLEEVLRLFAQ